ncbi:hypothetical protein [Methylotenera sp.]|uniref:hypothetical protein n=2 Tax=Methylotenera sp. TaxID=2051956 RepID=UPI002717FF55|nr:hypothetical protein [Methylotenera sp.]MDO9394882.1 hypothetical protein [Methylotenera sp.]MDP1523567.1 hypothetical protein [Methylotenera sp.]MDP1659116.1 hypothetical protein [Methylotenera sp.]MDP2070507.1 hypothetical protein [Methylotenera sp.]MDP2229920.1 hypothetical protein [Methylotenera sp.]
MNLLKTKLPSLGVLILALSLTGCATSIPQAENFSATKQKKVMAAQHWGVIAADAVEQTRLALVKQTFVKDKPLYVTDNESTEFSRAFRKYMIAGLLDAGFVVSAKKEGAVEVGFEAQVIRHASSFDPQAYGYKPGMATAGVAGFWVLRDALRYGASAGTVLATVAAAGGTDYYNAKNPGETGVELLISTSIIHADRYVMLNADAYYIEKGEAWLFEGCKGKNRRQCR